MTTPKDDTPRTDSTEGSDGSQRACDDLANLARTLERELAKAKAAIEAMPTCRCEMSTDDQCQLAFNNAQLRADIKQLRACIADALEAYNDADSQGVERRLLRGLEKHLLP
jgi:hypothetical protein